MRYPTSTTFSRPLPPKPAERHPAGTVPLTFRSGSAPCGCTQRWREDLQPARHPESDAAKTTPWPGATPFCPPSCGPKPLRALGVAPGHGTALTEVGFGSLPRPDLTKLWYRILTNSWYGRTDREGRGIQTRKENNYPCLS